MADKIKDADDRMLESMFRSEPIADNGFSDRVVRRVRRKLWMRRVTLPVAAAIGVSIAAKPVIAFLATAFGLLANLPIDVNVTAVADSVPQLPYIVAGAAILVSAVVGLRVATE